jgi:hypothetical protein
MLTGESYVKNNSLMLVQGNVGRVKKCCVVVGKSRRALGVIRTQLTEIITIRDNSISTLSLSV